MVDEDEDWSYHDFFQQEEAKIQKVVSAMQQCQQHTLAMMDILGTFEVKLTALEKQMLPIHEATQRLTTAQKNIDQTLQEVDRVIAHYNVASEAESSVEQRNITSDWESYLAWVDRVRLAKNFFSDNSQFKDSDKHLKKLNGFQRKCMVDCSKEFERLMQHHGTPMKRLEWPISDSYQLIPTQFQTRLMHIAASMADNGRFEFLEQLKKERGETFRNNIKKALSHDVNPLMAPQGMELKQNKQGPYQKGTSLQCFQLRFFLLMLEKEHALFQRILQKCSIATKITSGAWAEMVEKPLDYYLSKHDKIDKKEKDANKVLILLDMADNIANLIPRFQQLLKSGQMDKVHDLQRLTLAASKKALLDFKDSILEARQRSKQTTVDGTISPLSIETLNFLKRLYEYKDTIDGISKAALVEDSSDQIGTSTIFAITRMILNALEKTLNTKAKAFRSPALSKIFLLNNYYYVRRTVSKSNLEVGQDFNESIDKLITEARTSYLNYTWAKVLDILDTKDIAQQIPRPKDSGSTTERKVLSQNLRKKIKAKFLNFNTAFQKIYMEQSQYSVPDSDLRSSLRSENVEWVVEPYKEFLQLFRQVEFTTQPDKFFKYDALSLEACLDKFFDEEA